MVSVKRCFRSRQKRGECISTSTSNIRTSSSIRVVVDTALAFKETIITFKKQILQYNLRVYSYYVVGCPLGTALGAPVGTDGIADSLKGVCIELQQLFTTPMHAEKDVSIAAWALPRSSFASFGL